MIWYEGIWRRPKAYPRKRVAKVIKRVRSNLDCTALVISTLGMKSLQGSAVLGHPTCT